MTTMPVRYDDPLYERLARETEDRFGLPRGILDAIRTVGERSNANQVSPAGARGVYQFIPSTRRGMMRRYNIDPWSSPEAATEAAARHIIDDYRATGSYDTALRRYHGGPNPRRWGRQNRAYADRIRAAFGSFDEMPQNINIPETEVSADMPIYNSVTGETTMDQSTEPEKLLAPDDSGAPSKPVLAADEPRVRRRRGILGTLERIFMPDPGSLWAGALRDGLFNARESQQQYRQTQATQRQRQQMSDIERQQAELALKNLLTRGNVRVAGNNIVRETPTGEIEFLNPPAQPGETERLIDMWQRTPDGPLRELIERAIRGYQYTEPVIEAQTRGRERVARARSRTTPQVRNYGLPPGYVLEQ